MLPPRARAALREVYGPRRQVPPAAHARIEQVLADRRRASARADQFGRFLQVAALVAIVSGIFWVGSRPPSGRQAETARELAANKSVTDAPPAQASALADANPAASPSSVSGLSESSRLSFRRDEAAVSQPALSASLASNVTILDAFAAARSARASSTPRSGTRGFVPVESIDKVDELTAKAVGADVQEVRQQRSRTDAADPAVGLAQQLRKQPSAADQAEPRPQPKILVFDVMLDVAQRSLAAYQIELAVESPAETRITLMGVGGGEHPSLRRQPVFDSRRVSQPQPRFTIPIAHFDLGTDLPSGDVRIARVVMVVLGAESPVVTARMVVAAGPDGGLIPGAVRVVAKASRSDPASDPSLEPSR